MPNGFGPNGFGAGVVPLAAGPPPGVAGVEAVLGAPGAFGFPGGAKVGPPKEPANGSRPVPRIIEAICSMLRKASGFDLFRNSAWQKKLRHK
jgi:hypothetical protein